MFLFDTNVIIDYLRGYSPAIDFLDSFEDNELQISTITELELLKGCKNKQAQRQMDRFLRNLKIIPINNAISNLTLEIFRSKHLETQLGVFDSFIAATAKNHRFTLITRNTKHFDKISDLRVKAPY